jgi:hypothetical protein
MPSSQTFRSHVRRDLPLISSAMTPICCVINQSDPRAYIFRWIIVEFSIECMLVQLGHKSMCYFCMRGYFVQCQFSFPCRHMDGCSIIGEGSWGGVIFYCLHLWIIFYFLIMWHGQYDCEIGWIDAMPFMIELFLFFKSIFLKNNNCPFILNYFFIFSYYFNILILKIKFKKYITVNFNPTEKTLLLGDWDVRIVWEDFLKVRVKCKTDKSSDENNIFVSNGLFVFRRCHLKLLINRGKSYLRSKAT